MRNSLQPGGLAAVALGLILVFFALSSPAIAMQAGGRDQTVARTRPPKIAKPVVRVHRKPILQARAKKPGAHESALTKATPPLARTLPEPQEPLPLPYPLPPGTAAIADGKFAANPDPVLPAPAPYTAPALNGPETPPPTRPAPPPQMQGAPPAPAPVPQAPLALPAQVQQAPAPAIAPAGTPSDPQPVTHARKAGVMQCLNTLARASNIAIDADHEAFSTWATSNPDAHIFQSIAMIRYPNQVAPRSASVLLVTPTAASSCEGGTVQVIPTARSCAAIQAQLMQGGKAIASLSGLPLIETAGGVRQILLPAPGNGCVMISIGLITGPGPR